MGVLGLKALTPHLSKESESTILQVVIAPLQDFLKTNLPIDRQTDALVVICVILEKFGEFFSNEHLDQLQSVVMKLFDGASLRVEERKPALVCLSTLATYMGNEQFDTLLTTLLSRVKHQDSFLNVNLQVTTTNLSLSSFK
mgnify:CR=1 FL=1